LKKSPNVHYVNLPWIRKHEYSQN